MKLFIQKHLKQILSLSVIILLAVSLAGCGSGKSDSGSSSGSTDDTADFRADTVQVKVMEVASKNFVRTISSTGTLNARRQATVRAKVGGEIQHVYVDIGDRVRKGALLLKIDATDYKLDLQQAKAKLARAKASLDNAKKEIKRMKGLYKAGSATEQNRDQAVTAYQQAKADYQDKLAAKNTDQQRLDYTSIRAPFGGVVTKRYFKAGDYASASQAAAQLTDLSVLEAAMNIPEKYAGSIKKGLPVSLRFHSNLDSTKGKVTAVNPQIDTDSRTFLVKVKVINKDQRLSDGLFFKATFKLPEIENQPAVPASAVQSNEGQDILWVIKRGKAHRQLVQTGPKKGDWQMIAQGVKVGETVAVGGVGSLIDGYPVSASPVDSLTIEKENSGVENNG